MKKLQFTTLFLTALSVLMPVNTMCAEGASGKKHNSWVPVWFYSAAAISATLATASLALALKNDDAERKDFLLKAAAFHALWSCADAAGGYVAGKIDTNNGFKRFIAGILTTAVTALPLSYLVSKGYLPPHGLFTGIQGIQ